MECSADVLPHFAFTLDYVKSYISSSSMELLDAHFATTAKIAAIKAAYAAVELGAWLALVLVYGAIFLAKLCVMGLPHAVAFANLVVEFHRNQLSLVDIIIEVVILTTFLLYFLFRKRIHTAWHKFESSISKQYKSTIRCLPHIVFFSFSLLVALLGQNLLSALASPLVLPIFSLLIPIATSLILHVRQNNDTEAINQDSYDALRRQLLLWNVLAVYHSISILFDAIPFSGWVTQKLPVLRSLSLVVILWVQISPFFASVAFEAAAPFFRLLSDRLPSTDYISEEKASIVVTSLKAIGVLRNKSHELFLRSFLQDFVVIFFSSLFITTPSPLCYGGVVLAAFLFPALKTMSVVRRNDEDIRGDRLKPKGNQQKSSEVDLDLIGRHLQRWLRYWVCIGSLWSIRIYWWRVWPSVVICSALWLQHAYLDGATVVVTRLGKALSVLSAKSPSTAAVN